MLMFRSSKVAPLCWALWVVMGLGTTLALAGDHHHGTTYYSKVTQTGGFVAIPSTPIMGVGTYLPMTYSYPMVVAPAYATYSVAPTAHYVLAPGYATYGLSPMVPATSTGLSTASPLLKSAVGLAGPSEVQANADYLAEYTTFLQQESAKHPATIYQAAGVRPHPSDVVALNVNHMQLVAALGADRLASIGRFLLTKRQDLHFRANAIKLFEPLLGVYLAQYVPPIDRFLDDLRQGSETGDRVPPAPTVPVREPAVPPQVSSLELVKDSETGHFFAKSPDGSKIEFDANMKPLSIAKPDGKVTRLDSDSPFDLPK